MQSDGCLLGNLTLFRGSAGMGAAYAGDQSPGSRLCPCWLSCRSGRAMVVVISVQMLALRAFSTDSRLREGWQMEHMATLGLIDLCTLSQVTCLAFLTVRTPVNNG